MIFRFLVKVKRFLVGPRTELEFTRAALKRYNYARYIMEIEDRSYAYRARYIYLIDKIERVNRRIKWLEEKEKK